MRKSKIKAARKAGANAELARAFADIFTNRLRFVSATHMSTEQRKGAGRACRGAGCECVERCESAERAQQRVL